MRQERLARIVVPPRWMRRFEISRTGFPTVSVCIVEINHRANDDCKNNPDGERPEQMAEIAVAASFAGNRKEVIKVFVIFLFRHRRGSCFFYPPSCRRGSVSK